MNPYRQVKHWLLTSGKLRYFKWSWQKGVVWCEFQTLYPKSRIEIWNPVRPTTRRQPQDDQGSKESYPTNLDPAHLRTATILSQQATLQTGTDGVTGQGPYQGIIRWREPTKSELFQGEPKTTPEEIFDHIDGKTTVERAPLEGRSRDAGGTDAKEKDVTISRAEKSVW